ncbi:hypothetical protein PAXRUDRAFT_150441, partial [Paxillus rubicundulus Ve08.2h10]
QEYIKDFLEVTIPPVDPVCPGFFVSCQLGKQPNFPFTPCDVCAKEPFELVHSDLKSFEVKSYHCHKYIIVFYDNFTSMAWVQCL